MMSCDGCFRAFVSVFFSSLIAGFVYWLVSVGKYVLQSFLYGSIPIDAFIFLVPIILFSCGIGVFVCVPIIILLENFKLDRFVIYFPVSMIISISIVLFLSGYNLNISDSIASVSAALCGSLMFYKIHKR